MKVYQAINKVQKALVKEGITKNRTNSQGASYKFRGIDDIYNAVSPLMAEHGLCILPRVIARESIDRVAKSGGALFYVTVEVEFDFVSTEDGSKHTVKTFGEAMDSSDKATNKAMSAAYKYACIQAFAIPTEGDNDADAHTPLVATINDKEKDELIQKLRDAAQAFAIPTEGDNDADAHTPLVATINDKEKDELIQKLRDAAMLGTRALNDTFTKIPKSELKNLVWKQHSAELKKAADQVDLAVTA